MELLKDFGVYVVTLLIAIVGYFLRQKDEQQEKELKAMKEYIGAVAETEAKKTALLFIKHDEDVQRLANLEIHIAREHYLKSELDTRFDKVEIAIRGVGSKIDRLSDALLDHFAKEDNRK